MRHIKVGLCALMLVSVLGFANLATAQKANSAAAAKVEAKKESLGLDVAPLPEKYKTKLKLTKNQQSRVAKLNSSAKKEFAKLEVEGKNIPHSHAPGEPCPACAHSAKVRQAHSRYYVELAKILNNNQKNSLRALVAKDKAAEAKAAEAKAVEAKN
jgi:hypothetical protein